MVIFTETMAKLVSELAEKSSAKITVSEETVVFEFTTSEHKKPLRKVVDKNIVKSYHKNTKLYSFNGETLSVKEWAEKYSVPYRTMVGRLRKNGSPETTYRRGKEPKRVNKKG